jgi:hypothetical protein
MELSLQIRLCKPIMLVVEFRSVFERRLVDLQGIQVGDFVASNLNIRKENVIA